MVFCPLQFSLSCLALHHQTRQLLPENLQGTLQHSNKEANHVCNFDFSPVKMKMMQTCILAKCFSSAACSTARFLPNRSSAVSGPLTSLQAWLTCRGRCSWARLYCRLPWASLQQSI